MKSDFSKRGQLALPAVLSAAIMIAPVFAWTYNQFSNIAKENSDAEQRIAKLETVESNMVTTTTNQGNKIDYLVNAINKIGSKLNVDVGQPPINQ